MDYTELIRDLKFFGISGKLVSVDYIVHRNYWLVYTRTMEHIYCMDDDK